MTSHSPSKQLHLGTTLISLIDLLLILPQDSLAINLLRRRRQPVRRSPLLIGHDHAIDDLNSSQSALSACVL